MQTTYTTLASPFRSTYLNPFSNPFFHRGPVRSAKYFFDRTVETARAIALIGNLQNLSIVGQRRIGKTSFLYHLARPETFVEHGLPREASLVAYVDSEELADVGEPQVRDFIARRFVDALSHADRPSFSSGQLSHKDFRDLVERLTESGRRLIVLIDEFEALAANPALTPAFFSSLRSLSSQYNLAFVTASYQSLFDLSYVNKETLSSPFFNTFAHLNLGLFTVADASKMIETLASRAGLSLRADLVRRVTTLAGPHPFFLQMAAYHAVEAFEEAGKLASVGWEQRFETEALPHYQYYWDHLATDEQITLAALPFALHEESPVLHNLQTAALVRYTPERWTYLSPVLERFVRRQSVPNLLQFGPFVIDLSGRQALGSAGMLKLTRTEFDALTYFIQNAERVVSKEELETALWGGEYIEDPERVRVLIKSLRKALGQDSDHLATKWGEGYILQSTA